MSNKAKYTRRTEAQWHKLIESFDTSRLSITEFCKRNGIAVSSFYQWRARFEDNSEAVVTDEPAPSFIDLSDLSSADGRWSIVLKLGNGVELSLNQL